jgi:hypothetical protein
VRPTSTGIRVPGQTDECFPQGNDGPWNAQTLFRCQSTASMISHIEHLFKQGELASLPNAKAQDCLRPLRGSGKDACSLGSSPWSCLLRGTAWADMSRRHIFWLCQFKQTHIITSIECRLDLRIALSGRGFGVDGNTALQILPRRSQLEWCLVTRSSSLYGS